MAKNPLVDDEKRQAVQPFLDEDKVFESAIADTIKEGDIVLDAGCGNGEFSAVQKFRSKAGKIVGADIDKQALSENPYLDEKVPASVENLPFEAGCFDLVLSRALIEHLKDPSTAVSEFARVLKPGGRAVVQTFNIYSPVMFASAVLPLGLRKWLKERTLLVPEGTYPTYYRCNSKRKIRQAAARSGLKVDRLIRYGSRPDFWKHSLANSIFILLDRLGNNALLNFIKPKILVVFIKEPSPK